MSDSYTKVKIKAVLPTSGGCAVFIGNEKKIFIIYVDHAVGASISAFLQNAKSERPLTHDLFCHFTCAIGAEIKQVIINKFSKGVYYARIVFEIKNELGDRKIIEIDARPSDSIALALRSEIDIHVTPQVFDNVDDMRGILEKLNEKKTTL